MTERRAISIEQIVTGAAIYGTVGGDERCAAMIGRKLVELVRSSQSIDWSTVTLRSEYSLGRDVFEFTIEAIDRVRVFTIDEQLRDIERWMIFEAGRRFDAAQSRRQIVVA